MLMSIAFIFGLCDVVFIYIYVCVCLLCVCVCVLLDDIANVIKRMQQREHAVLDYDAYRRKVRKAMVCVIDFVWLSVCMWLIKQMCVVGLCGVCMCVCVYV